MNTSKTESKDARSYHHGDLRRSLIDAALALVTEEQNWEFSLREVARRADVSHNAPYNHFADKRDLLAAVAVVGYETLRKRMLASIEGVDSAEIALCKSGIVYVNFGTENPAHYRLMFSSALMAAEGRPPSVAAAGAATRAVIEGIIHRGAQTGKFSPALNRRTDLQIAMLSAWSAVHGLTMLAIDGLLSAPGVPIGRVVEKLVRTVAQGLK